MRYALPFNEKGRLQHLQQLQLVGSTVGAEFDAVVQLAAAMFDCPIALVSIIDRDQQWFKAKYGIPLDSIPREDSFCTHTILQDKLLVVPDAAKDDRFCKNPFVMGDPFIRFYAGCPLSIDGQHLLGALCVLDSVRKEPTDAQLRDLQLLGTVIEGLIRAHQSTLEAASATERAETYDIDLKRHSNLLEQIAGVSGVGGWELEVETSELTWTTLTRTIHEVSEEYEPMLESAIEFYAPESRQKLDDAVQRGIATGDGWNMELPFVTAKGRNTWVHAVGQPVFEDGVLVRLVGTIQDISQRKYIERTIREKSEELEVTLANMNQGVSAFDSDARLILWNQQYIDVFEKPAGEISEGVSFSNLLKIKKARGDFQGNISEFIDNLRTNIAQGKTVRARFTLKNGKIISSVHAPMPGGGWVGTHEDITLQEQAAEQVRYAANHDILTGLPNRSRFNAEVADLVQTAGHRNEPGILLLVGLDRYKNVNDTFGHAVGDELMKLVSDRFQLLVKKDDFVARLGGDEFAILLQLGSNLNEAVQLAKQIVVEIAKPFRIGSNLIEIGASVGVASTRQSNDDGLLTNADIALYKVKKTGRSGYQLFDEDLKSEELSRRHLERELNKAVVAEAMELYFQPVVSTRDRNLIGHEALLRWRDESGHFIPPSSFIPVAEQTGDIVQLGLWVIDKGIREAANWPETETLAINVSPRQLGSGRVLNAVTTALKRWGVAPSRLEIEVTESVLLDEDEGRLACLHQIKELGVSIALDDFGTGYSSLSCLHSFPFDRLKIDQMFVSNFERDPQCATIVKSVANLATSLGLESTAEGVETEEHFRLVTLAGCTCVQGFHFGRPVSIDDIAIHRERLNREGRRNLITG